MRLQTVLCLGGLSCLNWGCDPTCDKEATLGSEVEYTGGRTTADGTVYETNDWCEPWLHIPSGRSLRLRHGLKATPPDPRIYVSFNAEPYGDDCEQLGLTSPTAGNQVVIEAVNEDYIQIRNDTCEDLFHVRVVAETGQFGEQDAAVP